LGSNSIRAFLGGLIVPRVEKTYDAVFDLTPGEFDAAFLQYVVLFAAQQAPFIIRGDYSRQLVWERISPDERYRLEIRKQPTFPAFDILDPSGRRISRSSIGGTVEHQCGELTAVCEIATAAGFKREERTIQVKGVLCDGQQ
jgi:hypothetical protein